MADKIEDFGQDVVSEDVVVDSFVDEAIKP
jgi:hypothetical protein